MRRYPVNRKCRCFHWVKSIGEIRHLTHNPATRGLQPAKVHESDSGRVVFFNDLARTFDPAPPDRLSKGDVTTASNESNGHNNRFRGTASGLSMSFSHYLLAGCPSAGRGSRSGQTTDTIHATTTPMIEPNSTSFMRPTPAMRPVFPRVIFQSR